MILSNLSLQTFNHHRQHQSKHKQILHLEVHRKPVVVSTPQKPKVEQLPPVKWVQYYNNCTFAYVLFQQQQSVVLLLYWPKLIKFFTPFSRVTLGYQEYHLGLREGIFHMWGLIVPRLKRQAVILRVRSEIYNNQRGNMKNTSPKRRWDSCFNICLLFLFFLTRLYLAINQSNFDIRMHQLQIFSHTFTAAIKGFTGFTSSPLYRLRPSTRIKYPELHRRCWRREGE